MFRPHFEINDQDVLNFNEINKCFICLFKSVYDFQSILLLDKKLLFNSLTSDN